MLHIAFFEPRIPGNTGAAIRLAACTGAMLHLVEPLGFDMEDTKLDVPDLITTTLPTSKPIPTSTLFWLKYPVARGLLPVEQHARTQMRSTRTVTASSSAPNRMAYPGGLWKTNVSTPSSASICWKVRAL